tara:strand:- start:1828 stop:2814 length:987 start_codon:yes stop_codon:yes gene_type:complete
MIIKHFELKRNNLRNNKFYLIYGSNKGLIEEIIQEKLLPNLPKNYFKYDETEILKDPDNFKQTVFNKSFFESEKLIFIDRISDRILSIIEDIITKKVNDIYFVLVSESLDKKSKIRKLFEKETITFCIPVYEDNFETLSNMTVDFMKLRKFSVSQEIINIIVERAAGDRINLKNELEKIENFTINKKKISMEDILKITNLSENYSISELVDGCLSKNKIKTIRILNENNFNLDDCIIILRTFLIKLKRLMRLHQEIAYKSKNIDALIASFKPPIFWKDKEIVKQQIMSSNLKKTKDLMSKTNEVELIVKKNPQSSLSITTDFVISQTQ